MVQGMGLKETIAFFIFHLFIQWILLNMYEINY